MNNMTLKAIFFDLDGVLVISENFHYYAWEKVLEDLKVDHRNLDLKKVLGFSDEQVAKLLTQEYALSTPLEELIEQKRKYFSQYIQKGFAAPLRRAEFLKFLKNHTKLILAVVSSCLRSEIEMILKKENLLEYFDFLIGSDDVSKSKPSPEPYLSALKKATVKPQEALVIEDSPTGIAAALKAHIPIFGMTTTLSSLPEHPEITFFKNFKEIQKKIILNLKKH